MPDGVSNVLRIELIKTENLRKHTDVIKIFNSPPESSVILTDFDTADYCDSLRITDSTHNSPEQIAALLFKSPKWVDVLMSLRNLAMKPFGLKTGTATFPLIAQNEKERIMGLADRYLTFRVSVLTDREKSYVYVTTVVHYNNRWGKVYFLFVKPFHKIISVSKKSHI
jgi:hypothetical protein